MLISNLVSSRSGRKVPNQFVMESEGKVIFQSYQSVCAIYYRSGKLEVLDIGTTRYFNRGDLVLGEDWNYSKTTIKYLHQFLREYVPSKYDVDINTLRKMIKNGDITVLSNKKIASL